MRAVTKQDQELIEIAKKVALDNYDILHHCVGTALRTQSDVIFVGINMDGIISVCGEQVAISNAYVAGDKEIKTIVSVGVRKDGSTQVITPCGTCRQFFVEYAPHAEIITTEGVYSLQEMLPSFYKIHNR